MDIAIVGVLASLVAFRLIRMTTGRQAAGPLNKKSFLGHMSVFVLMFLYCIASGIMGLRRSRDVLVDLRRNDQALAATLLLQDGKAESALASASEALAAVERADPSDPELPTFLDLKGRCLVALQRYEEAEALYRRSQALRARRFGEEDPETALSENNLGTLYVEMGRNADAEAAFRRALARTEHVLGRVPPVLPVVLENLARICDRSGRAEEAKGYRERAKGFAPR